jgi:hypothetical protein
MRLKFPYWYLLLVPLFMNWIGALLNVLCIAVNHGQMPVLDPHIDCSWSNDPQDILHKCMTASTHLNILGDWIVMADGGIFKGMGSIGDKLQDWSDQLGIPCIFAWFCLMVQRESRSS